MKPQTTYLLVFWLISQNLVAQKSTPDTTKILNDIVEMPIIFHTKSDSILPKEKKAKKNHLGFRIGYGVSSFYEGGFPAKIASNAPMSITAGLYQDLFTRSRYNARLELAYIQKGSVDNYVYEGGQLLSTTKLGYMELTALPVVLKPLGSKKVNPFIGLGFYYGFKVTQSATIDNRLFNPFQNYYTQLLDAHKTDYGLSLSLGSYFKKRPLVEFRAQYGLANLLKGYNSKNRTLVALLSI